MFRLIDVHAHTEFSVFKNDADAVIRRALDAGIGIINVGTQADTSRAAVELARRYSDGVWAAVGLHPIHTEKSYYDSQELGGDKGFTSRGEDFDYDYYRSFAADPRVVVIGECGLDYFRIKNDESRIKNKQKDVFIKHLELAKELNKPLMIHCRPSAGTNDAYQEIFKILKPRIPPLKTIMHFYAGSLVMARQFLELGCYFTFGGVITFARDYDDVIKYIPLDQILLETDAPYVAPAPYRGKRNESAYIVETAKKLAEIKGINFETAAVKTTENASRVFKIVV